MLAEPLLNGELWLFYVLIIPHVDVNTIPARGHQHRYGGLHTPSCPYFQLQFPITPFFSTFLPPRCTKYRPHPQPTSFMSCHDLHAFHAVLGYPSYNHVSQSKQNCQVARLFASIHPLHQQHTHPRLSITPIPLRLHSIRNIMIPHKISLATSIFSVFRSIIMLHNGRTLCGLQLSGKATVNPHVSNLLPSLRTLKCKKLHVILGMSILPDVQHLIPQPTHLLLWIPT